MSHTDIHRKSQEEHGEQTIFRVKKNDMRFIDLFAGLGGFHLALSRLGHECVFASEIQPKLQKLYQLNFPHTPIAGDITKIKAEEIPPHELLCGGIPCQPFSFS